MADITQLALVLIGVFVTFFSVGYAAKGFQWLHSKVGASNYALLRQLATSAVAGAEKMYKSGEGQQKLQCALETVNAGLAKLGLSFDAKQVRSAIEEAVFGLPNDKAGETTIGFK